MDNVVESIFGLSPAQIQQRQNVGMMTAANNYANQDPLQRAAASMFAGGGMLAGAVAQAAGMMTPDMQQAQMTEQALQGLDTNSSKAIFERASQVQDPFLKLRLSLMAQREKSREIDDAHKQAQMAFDLHRANAEASPIGKIDITKATQESRKVYIDGGMKDPSVLVFPEKPQYESMSNEQKFVEAAADAQGLKTGSPERMKFTADAYKKLMDKRTNININGSGAVTKDSADTAIDLALAGDPTMLTGWGRSPKDKAAIINRITERMKSGEITPQQFAAAKIAFNTTKAADSKIGVQLSVLRPFVGMVDKNGEVLKTLADKAIVTNVALANRPINWIEQNIGDHPDMAEFLAQVKIFKDEAARVVSNPNLVGVLSDTARKEMENVISGNMPLKSMRRVIERLQADSHNRISSMEEELVRNRTPKTKESDSTKPSATVSNW